MIRMLCGGGYQTKTKAHQQNTHTHIIIKKYPYIHIYVMRVHTIFYPVFLSIFIFHYYSECVIVMELIQNENWDFFVGKFAKKTGFSYHRTHMANTART